MFSPTKNLAEVGSQSPDELLGKTLSDFYRYPLPPRFFADEQNVLQNAHTILNREQFTDASGKPFWLLTTKVPLIDEQGNVTGLAGIGRDITEIKRTRQDLLQAKEALAQERQVLRTLIDNVPDFIYVKDAQGRYLLANAAVARKVGRCSRLSSQAYSPVRTA